MIEILNIALDFDADKIPVGRLLAAQRRINFEFHDSFLHLNYDISPFNLPKKSGVQAFDPSLFEGLPGVFNDSLPDGWGRLLLDRSLRSHGVNPATITPLDRLSHVGLYGIGALIYEPEITNRDNFPSVINLDLVAAQVGNIMQETDALVLDQLMSLNGSSAGARPKALIGLDRAKKKIIHGVKSLPDNYEHWMVKFANSLDMADIGAVEYVYSEMAKLAGIVMPETYLFTSKKCAGYFATKRFDRNGNKRLHAHTACGLLHSDYRVPTLDYTDLLQLTMILTKNIQEVEKMFRLAVFNVCAHNRDDHSKNFTYLMDAEGAWTLSPAYDLTFSSGPNGEQSTTVCGEGRNPGIEQLKNLAIAASLQTAKVEEIIEQCCSALAKWPTLARNAGVSNTSVDEIGKQIIKKLR